MNIHHKQINSYNISHQQKVKKNYKEKRWRQLTCQWKKKKKSNQH